MAFKIGTLTLPNLVGLMGRILEIIRRRISVETRILRKPRRFRMMLGVTEMVKDRVMALEVLEI